LELRSKNSRVKLVASGLVPFALLIAMIAYIFGPGSNLIEFGVPLPEITIEKIDFKDAEIHVMVRNTGPIPLEVVMADVNDRIQPAAIEPDRFLNRFETALVRIPYEWNVSEPYKIGLTTNDGIRFEKEVISAAPALEPDLDFTIFLGIIGMYVGVVPVMIGLLWMPFIKKINQNKFYFFMSLTCGLLLFLGIDALVESFGISNEHLSSSFNAPLLISTTTILSFLGLYYTSEKLTSKTGLLKISKPVAIGLMISIGIGLHNFGEGLAIGASIGLGSIAFSTFLIVGFALHNTTEGLAIAAPLSKEKTILRKLILFGLIAGVPAIFGSWVGGFAFSPFSAVIFLSIGAGAIFQVIVVILKWIRLERENILTSGPVISGFAVGMLIMYFTSILI
jgi:ZIP family zinc transporter